VNLILVGYRGAGKTTVGEMLARCLGWTFMDLDDLVCRNTGKTIREIFATEGETGFRQREREALGTLRRVKEHIIALGGGALTHPEIPALARRIGKIIYLRAPAAVLWARISKDPSTFRNRPDLTSLGGLDEVEKVLAEREGLYESASHHIVDTMSHSPAEVAEALELWVEANDADRE